MSDDEGGVGHYGRYHRIRETPKEKLLMLRLTNLHKSHYTLRDDPVFKEQSHPEQWRLMNELAKRKTSEEVVKQREISLQVLDEFINSQSEDN